MDRAAPDAKPDLVLTVAGESPLALIQSALSGVRPAVSIEGDVQLAAEIAWLAENLRWDAEEDLSRLIGDAPAFALANAGRKLTGGLRQILASSPFGNGSVKSASPAAQPTATEFTDIKTPAASVNVPPVPKDGA